MELKSGTKEYMFFLDRIKHMVANINEENKLYVINLLFKNNWQYVTITFDSLKELSEQYEILKTEAMKKGFIELTHKDFYGVELVLVYKDEICSFIKNGDSLEAFYDNGLFLITDISPEVKETIKEFKDGI